MLADLYRVSGNLIRNLYKVLLGAFYVQLYYNVNVEETS